MLIDKFSNRFGSAKDTLRSTLHLDQTSQMRYDDLTCLTLDEW